MERRTVQKPTWSLTREAWEKFLACLDRDAEKAGEKYEAVRLLLIKFFDWRGALYPEEYADETINRVIRKVDEGERIQDLPTFCHGVARLVLLETLKRPENKRTDIEEITPSALVAPTVDETSDPQQQCFYQCLQELPLESRSLIMQYYQDEKRDKIKKRLGLAQTLGIPLNALRSRAQRIRDKLEDCVHRCQKKK
jgi:DNA-directed RNA polymerase specialized sigma24 family protein